MNGLKEGQVLVLGISTYEKNGNRSFTLYGQQTFSDYEVENGAVGYKSLQEWTNRVDLSLVHPGDIIELRYGKGFQGRAVLENVVVVAPAGKSDK